MNLLDEEKEVIVEKKNSKLKKILIFFIAILVIFSIIIAILIKYRKEHPTTITSYINSILIKDFDKMLDVVESNDETKFYFPIKKVAETLGYKVFSGDYYTKTENNDMCYVEIGNKEVAIFSVKSDKIYKINVEDSKNNTYDYITIDNAVYENNGILYTTEEGIEKGLNVLFNYDSKKKIINIYTLDALATGWETQLKKIQIGNYGQFKLDSKYANLKAILNGMIVVTTANKKYGVLNVEKNYSMALEPKYNDIEYITYSGDFLVKTDTGIGLISSDKKTKISASYDELELIDREARLYKIKKGNQYGVINENEKIIIHPEFESIGIDIEPFTYNGIRDKYILVDTLIPAKQNKKWGFFNKEGKLIKDFIYDEIGCQVNNENNVHSLLVIPEYKVIVVKKDNNYSFMNENGNDNILQFIFSKIYMKYSGGEVSYYMTYNDKNYNAIKYLKNAFATKEE